MTALHNKHVLVTGGARGIGRLLALGCARVGAAVTIWDLDEEGAGTRGDGGLRGRRRPRRTRSPAT